MAHVSMSLVSLLLVIVVIGILLGTSVNSASAKATYVECIAASATFLARAAISMSSTLREESTSSSDSRAVMWASLVVDRSEATVSTGKRERATRVMRDACTYLHSDAAGVNELYHLPDARAAPSRD